MCAKITFVAQYTALREIKKRPSSFIFQTFSYFCDIMNKMTKIAAAAFAAVALVGCFPEGEPTPTLSDVVIEGTLKDYYQKPIEGLQVIMYRKMEEKQTLMTTPDSLICDTTYSDAYGKYQARENNKEVIAINYGIHISDTTQQEKYRTIEEECYLPGNAKQYIKNGKYEIVYTFSPIIFPNDWPGFDE